MTDVTAGDTSAASVETPRLATADEVAARLDRIEQLEDLDRRAGVCACGHRAASAERSPATTGTTVVFTDEPCAVCGEQSA